ncbi:MAG TPA: tRNA pseudouridine(38-40) synthase TruA [Rubrobacteraceae bacterium]|nr:tRNA pseudouridine(38-40) synthase TruA [Rubrobacteraceae bacterium]
MKYAGLVEYDGAGFSGWAAQPGRRTVEETLAEALEIVLRQPVKLTVAGRTDAGVHATGQIVSFQADTSLPPALISYKSTAVLPDDVALRRCVQVTEDFDVRFSAKSRSYEYRLINDPIRSPLLRRRAIHVARELDLDLLREAASRILGVHDFRAFTYTKSHHTRFERTVEESRWETRGGLLVYEITANSFLYGMVRALVGTMLEVGEGKRKIAEFARLLHGGERSGAGPAAPARGLTLVDVSYEDLNFDREANG